MGKVPCIKTAGELKKVLATIPDNTPLAIADHGVGWGLKPPFLAEFRWATEDHTGYVTKEQASEMEKDSKKAKPSKLNHPVCVIEPGTEHF